MADEPVKSKYSTFTPHAVHMRNVEFTGNPPSLSVFPGWVWYTPAPACLWGGLGNDILSELQDELGLEYYRAIFDVPIFTGFEDKVGDAWNRTLWAIAQPDWSKFKDGLLGVTNVDIGSRTMVKYGLQELTIYDPLVSAKSGVITPESPTVFIYVFGVMSNKVTIAFNPAQSLVELPHVYTQRPEAAIVELANRTLREEADLGEIADNVRTTAQSMSEYDDYVTDRLRKEGEE
jgi:hypothetical protein